MWKSEWQKTWRDKKKVERKEKWLPTWSHLTENEKLEIIKLRRDGETIAFIAKRYWRSISWIAKILKWINKKEK